MAAASTLIAPVAKPIDEAIVMVSAMGTVEYMGARSVLQSGYGYA